MKKRAMIISALAALISAPLLSNPSHESEAELIFTAKYASAFMFRGVKLGGPSFMPALEYEKGPWAFGVEAVVPLGGEAKYDMHEHLIKDGYQPFAKNETDFIGSYKWEVNEHFSISPGLTLYTFPNAGEGEYDIIVEPKLSFGYKVEDLNFSLNFYYDFMQKGPTYEFGFDYSIPLGHDHCELELSALVGRYDWSDMEDGSHERVKESGDYFQAGAAVVYEFNKHAKMTIGCYYENGFNNYEKVGHHKEKNQLAKAQAVFHAGISIIF
jgi:hypothetical protein